MSVLKYYNTANAAWETAIVGAQGATGATAADLGANLSLGGTITYISAS
jgi:hypothetical protein